MAKNIVVCLDGTWNNDVDSETPQSNPYIISEICATRLFDDVPHVDQMVRYWPGVGTNQWLPIKWLNGALGRGVFSTARQAWRDLCLNYRPDDKIFIFGFSRGAYAARQLASMICRFGVSLTIGAVELAFREWFASPDARGSSPPPGVHFLGLFDCVPGNQLYLLRHRRLRCTVRSADLEDGIVHFRHAVSSAERRWSFQPTTFQRASQTTFAQHWFPGYHCDVGGASEWPTALSSFSLWWMLREAFGVGLHVNAFDCPRHRAGNALGVLATLDPESPGTSSDWFTTTLGLRYVRTGASVVPNPDPPPRFEDLDACPHCAKDMFEYFATVPGQRFLARVRPHPQCGA